jgi:MFS family permease
VAASYLDQVRHFNRDVRLYLLSRTMVGFGYFGFYSVLFNLYLLRLGYGPGFVGLVNATGFLTNALFSLPAGALGRRWGSRRAIIRGMGLMLVAIALPPLTHSLPAQLRAGWLLVTYALSWLGGALYIVNGPPFLMGAASQEDRNHAFSVQVALSRLAAFIGSLIAGLLPGLFSTILHVPLDQPALYGYPLFVVPLFYGLGLLALLSTRGVRGDQPQEAEAQAGRAPYGLIALIGLVMMLQVAGEWAARVFSNVYLDAGLHTPTVLIGTIFAAAQLLSVPAALAMPLLARRWGTGHTVLLASIGVACSLLPLALIPHWAAGGLGFIGMSVMASILLSAFSVFHQEVVPVHWRTVASGARSMAMGVSSSAMAYGGGYIIGAVGYRSLFLIAAALTACGTLLFWVAFRRPGQTQS